jgi:hypothetical protein
MPGEVTKPVRVYVRREAVDVYVAWMACLPEVELRAPSRQDVIVEMHMAVVEAFDLHGMAGDEGLLEVVDLG